MNETRQSEQQRLSFSPPLSLSIKIFARKQENEIKKGTRINSFRLSTPTSPKICD